MGDYLLFAGHCYYPEGGAKDYRGRGTIDELMALYAKHADKWSQDNGSYIDPWGQIACAISMRVLYEVRAHDGWTKL